MKNPPPKPAGKPKELIFTAEGERPLLEFLFGMLSGRSRTTVKSYLSHRQVTVNHVVTTRFDHPLRAGDRVGILSAKGKPEFRHPMLKLVYEDDGVIVIDKNYGLLSMGTDREREKTAYHVLSSYVKQEDPSNRIFILHRLDRETSGLMVFARSEEVQQAMQSRWNEVVVERKYYAVVEGVPRRENDTVRTFLAENKVFKVYATTQENGREAVLHYRTLSKNRDYALLEVELETGRKNQIRAQMESIGHPVAGDKKYGAATNPLDRVALHAGVLSFIHPRTGERMSFQSPVPYKFRNLFGRRSR